MKAAAENSDIKYECSIHDDDDGRRTRQLSSSQTDGSAGELSAYNPSISTATNGEFTLLGGTVAYAMREVISSEDICRHDDVAQQDVNDDETIHSNTQHGQSTTNISKKLVYVLMSACVLMSAGAEDSMMTKSNPASVDPMKTATTSRSYSSAIFPIDDVETETINMEPFEENERRRDQEVTFIEPSFTPSTVTNTNGCEGSDEKWFKLELTTDDAGNETSWELEQMEDDNWTSFNVSNSHESNQNYVVKMCIQPAEYRFTIRDSGNDGLCCGNGFGSYAGYLRGAKIFESPIGDDDWGERVHTFTLPSKSSDTTTSDVPSLSPSNSSIPSASPSNTTMTYFPTKEKETLQPTQALTAEPTNLPTNPPSNNPTAQPTNLPSHPPTVEPTRSPTNSPSSNPTAQPTDLPSHPPTAQPTNLPTNNPTANPSPAPSPRPTPQPTPPPTMELPQTEDTVTKIFLVADCPYDDKERQQTMPQYIDNLETDGDFLVHLGDLMYAVSDRCREGAYAVAAQILRRARMPTFVLPGDNDINDCPSIQHGEAMWMKYFYQFDKKYWNHSFDVTRWGRLQESFGFLNKRVLFLGLNMVGGTPYSWSEKTDRHREHLEKVQALFRAHEGQFDVIVLMKHADPGRNHRDFFGDGDGDGLFIDMIRRMGKPTIHFHGDNHSYYESEGDYGVRNYMRISLVGESNGPPLAVTIDVSKPNPITVSRRQNNLRVNCCAEGWPRQ